MDRPLFRGVEDALRFLLNPDRVSCDRPPSARLADKRRGEPGLLAGADGSAEAATAHDMLRKRLSGLHWNILVCRYAPATTRCECRSDCCSGKRPNQVWQEAVRYVAQDAVQVPLRGCDAHLRFVMAVLIREYSGTRSPLVEFGASLGMASGTCTLHKNIVLDWLLGSRRAKKDPTPGQESVALKIAEDVLTGGGFLA